MVTIDCLPQILVVSDNRKGLISNAVSHVQIDTPFYDGSQDQSPIDRLYIHHIAAMLILVTTIVLNFTSSLSDHYIIISYHPFYMFKKFWKVIQYLKKKITVHPKM